jgi:hypothetical protein
MSMTEPVDWIDTPRTGYVMNAEFSETNKDVLMSYMQRIQETFGESVFCTPRDSLHVTLLDWVAPLVDYDGKDKTALYKEVRSVYNGTMTEILSAVKSPIKIHFEEFRVSPTTIYMVGKDNGEFQTIRSEFVTRVQLLPNTKLPPTIVHCSLARFIKPIDLQQASETISKIFVDFEQDVTNFRLLRSYREPLLEFKLLKRYEMSG